MSDKRVFTLPVWVAAAAKAATQILLDQSFSNLQKIVLPDEKGSVEVPIRSAGLVDGGKKSIGISFCQSGLSLDITRDLEIWTYVQIQERKENIDVDFGDSDIDWLEILGGYGVGKFAESGGICISKFAENLIAINLKPLVPKGYFLRLEIVFPSGKELAERTSNSAFGVVDGLALIGIQSTPEKSAAPDQLQKALESVTRICSDSCFAGDLIFVIGENGFDLAMQSGINSNCIIKTGNWLGPLLVAASQEKVNNLLIFGYHGKLVKLAGGIFHTHNHLADGRIEVLTSIAIKEKLPIHLVSDLTLSSSMEAAWLRLKEHDFQLANKLWFRVALEVERRSTEYFKRYSSSQMEIGSILFDRQRKIRWPGPHGLNLLESLGLTLHK